MSPEPGCCCAHNVDGSVTTMLCPLHADDDPCATKASVTGRRRRGSISAKGKCSNCGWTRPSPKPARTCANCGRDPGPGAWCAQCSAGYAAGGWLGAKPEADDDDDETPGDDPGPRRPTLDGDSDCVYQLDQVDPRARLHQGEPMPRTRLSTSVSWDSPGLIIGPKGDASWSSVLAMTPGIVIEVEMINGLAFDLYFDGIGRDEVNRFETIEGNQARLDDDGELTRAPERQHIDIRLIRRISIY